MRVVSRVEGPESPEGRLWWTCFDVDENHSSAWRWERKPGAGRCVIWTKLINQSNRFKFPNITTTQSTSGKTDTTICYSPSRVQGSWLAELISTASYSEQSSLRRVDRTLGSEGQDYEIFVFNLNKWKGADIEPPQVVASTYRASTAIF